MNTSFNVAAPIAQSPVQALDTLRRANGMDGVFIFSDDGPVVWLPGPRSQEPELADGSENGWLIGGAKLVPAPRPDRGGSAALGSISGQYPPLAII